MLGIVRFAQYVKLSNEVRLIQAGSLAKKSIDPGWSPSLLKIRGQ